jgi:hypothetical protein
MIGNHEKVVGPAQPGGHTGAGDDRLPSGEAVGVLRPERAADHAGISRVTGVQMRIAEEDLVGEMLFRIGRILHLRLVQHRVRRVLGGDDSSPEHQDHRKAKNEGYGFHDNRSLSVMFLTRYPTLESNMSLLRI